MKNTGAQEGLEAVPNMRVFGGWLDGD
jgi:hypothetical protein